MPDPEDILEARKMLKRGMRRYNKGDLDKACPLLTKALSIFMNHIDEKGCFEYPEETAELLCSLPYGCIIKAKRGDCGSI